MKGIARVHTNNYQSKQLFDSQYFIEDNDMSAELTGFLIAYAMNI